MQQYEDALRSYQRRYRICVRLGLAFSLAVMAVWFYKWQAGIFAFSALVVYYLVIEMYRRRWVREIKALARPLLEAQMRENLKEQLLNLSVQYLHLQYAAQILDKTEYPALREVSASCLGDCRLFNRNKMKLQDELGLPPVAFELSRLLTRGFKQLTEIDEDILFDNLELPTQSDIAPLTQKLQQVVFDQELQE